MDQNQFLKRALFLHIQKTAGTSIVDLARGAYGNDNVVSHGDYLLGSPDKSLDKIIVARGHDPEDFHSFPFVSGHFGFDYARTLFADRFSFTFLRDPIERVLSYYYFALTRNPNEYEIYALAQAHSLDEFLKMGLDNPWVKDCIWNNQVWQLACGYGNADQKNVKKFSEQELMTLAIEHLDAFSHVGFTETFEQDRDIILKQLGIVPPDKNIVSNATPNRPKSGQHPASTMKLLRELTHLDQRLYDIAWQKYKQRGLRSKFFGLLQKIGFKRGVVRL